MYVHFLRSGKRGDDENEGEQFLRSRKRSYTAIHARKFERIFEMILYGSRLVAEFARRVKPIIQQRRERFVSQESLAHVEHAALLRFEPGWIRVSGPYRRYA